MVLLDIHAHGIHVHIDMQLYTYSTCTSCTSSSEPAIGCSKLCELATASLTSHRAMNCGSRNVSWRKLTSSSHVNSSFLSRSRADCRLVKISRGRTKGEGRGSVGIVIAAVHMHSMYMYMCTGVYSTCKYRQRRRGECRVAVMGFWWLCV